MIREATKGQVAATAPRGVPRSLFTYREVEIIGWLAAGSTMADIGRRLRVSEATVRVHLASMRTKTEAMFPGIRAEMAEGPVPVLAEAAGTERPTASVGAWLRAVG